MPLSVNAAVPCGLILNELASNALKHAFRDRVGGEVIVSLRGGAPGRVCLRVRDNGTGLPAGLDWRQADSLGLRLVQMLAKQLHAAVEVSSGEGTEFVMFRRIGKTASEDRRSMSKTTILIVEDEAIVAADLAGKLRRLGYEVAGITARRRRGRRIWPAGCARSSC